MLITCKCLNLSINAKNGAITMDLEKLNLSTSEQSEAFFRERNIGVIDPVNISKELPGLMQVHSLNNWTFHRCLNCNTNTHALKKNKNGTMILVNMNLVTHIQEINSLRKSDKYSPVFKIVLDHPEVDPESVPTFTKYTVSQQSDTLQTSLTALQHQLSENIQRQVAETERRIRIFTEEQYSQLEEFRERVHYDHRLLANILRKSIQKPPQCVTPSRTSESKTQVISPNSPTSEISPANNLTTSPTVVLTDTINTDTVLRSKDKDLKNKTSGLSKLTKTVSNNSAKRQSLDSEGLFDLEFAEDENLSDYSETEQDESGPDSSDDEEGLTMTKVSRFQQHVNESTFAKSLPISVPTFMGPRTLDLDSDSDLPANGMDIAASIKALAKSVHGDTVFGDLPRPRFSTQI